MKRHQLGNDDDRVTGFDLVIASGDNDLVVSENCGDKYVWLELKLCQRNTRDGGLLFYYEFSRLYSAFYYAVKSFHIAALGVSHCANVTYYHFSGDVFGADGGVKIKVLHYVIEIDSVYFCDHLAIFGDAFREKREKDIFLVYGRKSNKGTGIFNAFLKKKISVIDILFSLINSL